MFGNTVGFDFNKETPTTERCTCSLIGFTSCVPGEREEDQKGGETGVNTSTGASPQDKIKETVLFVLDGIRPYSFLSIEYLFEIVSHSMPLPGS